MWKCVCSARTGLPPDARGTVAVEFAAVGLIFCLLVLGTIELGRYQIAAQSLRSYTAEAARAALISVNRGLATGACTQARLNTTDLVARAPMLDAASLTTTVSTDCSARRVTVTTRYPFALSAPILSRSQFVLTDTADLSF